MLDEADDRPDDLDGVNPYASPRTPCAATDEELPAAVAAKIDRLLEPGESIVWQGRSRFSVVRFLVVIAFEAVVLSAAFMAIARFAVSDPILIGGLFLACVLTIAGVGLLRYFTARNAAFTLTTRRMLYLPPIGDHVQSHLPEEVNWKSRPTRAPEDGPREAAYRAVPPWSLSSHAAHGTRVRNLVCDTLLPELARRLRHTDPLVRRRSAACFARMGPADGCFARSLLAALRDDDGVVRRHAVIALGNGCVASARAELERLRFDDDRWVAQSAIDALDRLAGGARGE